MSLTITVAQRKGGAGKTTLACQLAAALSEDGFRVAGVDCDPQGSFSLWGARRASVKRDIDIVDAQTDARFSLGTSLWGLKKRADIIIIDTPPSADRSVRNSIEAADIVLAPLQLSRLDLDAILPTAELVGEIGREVLFVVNRAPARSRVGDQIRGEIEHQSLPLAGAELGNRTAFIESIAAGLGVVETSPRSAAASEIRKLAGEIMTLCGDQKAGQDDRRERTPV